MVDSDASGVAFSRSPVKNNSLVRIEAGYGIGEGCSGIVDVDSYELIGSDKLFQKYINKRDCYRFSPKKKVKNKSAK